MATHSSILAWEIPWTGERGRLQLMGHKRVGHGLVTKQQQQPHVHFQGDYSLTTGAHMCTHVFYLSIIILATPPDMWDLSSLTRDRTCSLCSGIMES